MSNRTSFVLWSCLFSLVAVSSVHADWPRWRGSDFSAISTESINARWSRSGPKKAWTSNKGGLGYAGFSVVNNVVYTMGAFGKEEYLLAFDSKSQGRLLFRTKIGPLLKNGWGDGPRSTPTVDDGMIYAMSAQGHLNCVDLKGKVRWRVTMGSLGGKVPQWGYTESPLVDGDLVICTPGGGKGSIAALNKKTGKVVWMSKGFTQKAQYASVTPIEWGGKRQYMQLTMKKLVGIDAANGKVLWQADWPGKTAVIPTPIFNDGYIFVSAGYGVGCKLYQVSKDFKVKEVYSNKNMKNHHGGVIFYKGHLFGSSDGRGVTCMDFKTGKVKWSNKKSTKKGAISIVGDKLIFLEEGTGEVVLAEASTSSWKELGRFTLSPQTQQRADKGKIWVHPVVSNGKLYLRDQEIIFCFDVKS